MIIGRYAPSPTGPLHYGNLRTALFAWLQARLSNGVFILRIDDLDKPRNKTGSLEQIIFDLQWLGIDWDEGPFLQSQRGAFYTAAFNQLKDADLVFPCDCSRKDIALALNTPDHNGKTGIYPGICRLKPAMKTGQPAWRFKVDNRQIMFTDHLLGNLQQNLATTVGDFVIKRKDGLFAYQLATVVDDALMGITDVLRGADLCDSTARQLSLCSALAFNPPRFWHAPLIIDSQGRKMSKRIESESLVSWRKQDKNAEQFIGFIAYSSALIDKNETISCQELCQHLTVESFIKALKQ